MPSTQTSTAAKKTALFDDDKEGQIYRTAAQMIHERGFAATSMNQIAEALEMTKPGLYYYVKGKKELLFKITSYAMDRLDEAVVEPAARIQDAEARLRSIVHGHARLLMSHVTALGILIDEVEALAPADKKVIVARKRNYLDLVRRTIDEVQSTYSGRKLDSTVAAFSLLGMVMWLSRWFRPEGKLDAATVADDITEIALRALLRGDAAPTVPPVPFPVPAT
ncbi:MAG: TetR/AcrR family transcriptional regulator [Acidobacteriota bacterium]